MIHLSLLTIAGVLLLLTVFVWRAKPQAAINRWFATFTALVAGWTLGIAGWYEGRQPELWAAFTFANASFIPFAFLKFSIAYPTSTIPLSGVVFVVGALGSIFCVLSLTTSLVIYDAIRTLDGLSRKAGPLYVAFALYFVSAFGAALWVFYLKWQHAVGVIRAQLQYLGAALMISSVGAMTANLLIPLFTGRSTYSWIGPYFGLLLVGFVAHAIIRHRIMDLHLVIHRGLTAAIAIILSLVPVTLLLISFWSKFSVHLESDEMILFLTVAIVVSIMTPITRDIANVLLNRYVYRARSDYQQTVRAASKELTRVMDMSTLLPFLTQNFASATQCEGVAVYLQVDGYFKKQFDHRRHPASLFETPDRPPSSIIDLLQETREVISLTQMTAGHLPEHRLDSYKDFAPLNWSLILPLVSEDAVIGAIAIGPKLSGDPFYPQDLDLLTTLANQAGIAIKNAQLYAEVVLANEYIENIVATINSGVVAINPAGRITMFNRAAEQLTDLTSDAVASQPVTILPERLGAALMLAVHDGHPVTQPEIALPGGTVTRPVICTTSPLRDASGAILGAVAVFSDLTPLKELEIERRRAEKLAYFEALASGLAHEIKNPLVAIKTFAQLFPRRYMDEKFATDFGPKVTREIERMERLVERLQTLARPSERPHRPLDLRVPLREAVEFMQPVLDEKGLTLVTGLGEMPTIILGEHDELKQLILNLLMNAHEATPPGGTVIVELAATATDATVTVADAGPGIPAELLERVFDPFFTTKRRGTGLGLAICSGIADAHRAKLRAANRATGGALMTVEFPLAKTATTEVMT